MRKSSTRARRTTGWLLSALILTVYFSPHAQLLRSLPKQLSVASGQSAALEAPFPLRMEVQAAEAVKGGVYYIDWKSQMDPEALAEWEAFDPNDPAFLAQMEEADQMGEEVQQQLNEAMENIDMDEINQQLAEAMQELEGIGLPEGYEDILSGLDLSGLMGG